MFSIIHRITFLCFPLFTGEFTTGISWRRRVSMLHSLSVTWFSCDYPALSPFTLKVLPTLWVGKTKMCGAHCNTRLTSFLTVSLLSLLRPSFLASCTDSFITDSWKFSLISFLSDTTCLVFSSPQTFNLLESLYASPSLQKYQI